MKLRALLGAGVLASVAPMSALAQGAATGATPPVAADAFSDWKSFCVSHRDDFTAAIAAADAGGWTAAPEALARRLAGSDLGQPVVRLHAGASGGLRLLIVGASTKFLDAPAAQGVKARFCGVAVLPADSRLPAEIASFAAVPPNSTFAAEGATSYAYRRVAGTHEPVVVRLDSPQGLPLLRDGWLDVVMMKSSGDPDMTLVVLAVPQS